MSSAAHLPEVLEEYREDLPLLLKNANQAELDRNGRCTVSVRGSFRAIAVLSYLVERNVNAFRTGLSRATDCQVELFDRFDAGEPIDPSHVTMLAYKHLLDALASGDMAAATTLAERLANRESYRSFESAFGSTLMCITLNSETAAKSHLKRFEVECREKAFVNFAGYATFLGAVLTRNEHAANAGLANVVAGHRRLSKGRGMFASTLDEWLCVWGVGLVNLARSRGLDVAINDPLIPNELKLSGHHP